MQTRLPFVSSTLDVSERMGWPLADIMAAKVLVKRLVQSGMRKGPTDLLVLPDHLIEEWYNAEAVRYLQEQKEKRSKPIAVIP